MRLTDEAHVPVCRYVTYIMLWQTLLAGAGMGLQVMGQCPVPISTNTHTHDLCGSLRPMTLPNGYSVQIIHHFHLSIVLHSH